MARLGNLSAAADFLGITGSAVSHRIRGLEKELDVQLLRRSPRGLSLTAAGRRYQAGVEGAFAGLAEATAALLGPDFSRPLTISLTSEFGLQWLMPRFPRFRAQHPEIDTAILNTYQMADLQAGEADVALRYGAGHWPGVEVERVLEFEVAPVCAPAVQQAIAGLPPGEALAGQTRIREDDLDWVTWLAAAGIENVKPRRQLQFRDYSMALASAVAGQGILLGYSGYVDTEVAAGQLVYPFDLRVSIAKAYYLVYCRERLADPRVRAFRAWVLAEAATPWAALPEPSEPPA